MHTGSAGEVMYLVGQLIERGQATVFRDGSTRAEPSVVVHDYNGVAGGFQRFDLVGGASFLSYPTWVA